MIGKRIGWVGIVKGKPYFEEVTDNYVENFSPGVQAVNIYKSKKEAKRRFKAVKDVFIKT